MELRMDAYYYSFTPTGVREIDLILSAVACAGKAFHHTQNWQNDAYHTEDFQGSNPVEWIQNAANEAAKKWNTRITSTDSSPNAEPE